MSFEIRDRTPASAEHDGHRIDTRILAVNQQPARATTREPASDRIVVVAPAAMIGMGIAEIIREIRPEMRVEYALRRGLVDSDVAPDVRLVVQALREWPDPAAEAPRAWLERVPVMLLVPRPDALVEAAARRAGYAAVVPFTQGAVAMLAKAAELLDVGDGIVRERRRTALPPRPSVGGGVSANLGS